MGPLPFSFGHSVKLARKAFVGSLGALPYIDRGPECQTIHAQNIETKPYHKRLVDIPSFL